jgi:hypothetical protein
LRLWTNRSEDGSNDFGGSKKMKKKEFPVRQWDWEDKGHKFRLFGIFSMKEEGRPYYFLQDLDGMSEEIRWLSSHEAESLLKKNGFRK